jgi:diguanylate cyclase (GGDEF)-like protein
MAKARFRHPNTLVFVIALTIGCYLAALVAYAYFGQQRLRDALLSQERLLLSQKAAEIGYFLDTQSNRLQRLSTASPVVSYAAHRALGMSPDDGPRASLQTVVSVLHSTLKQEPFDGRPVFRRLALTDTDGQILADSLMVSASVVDGPKRLEFMPTDRPAAIDRDGEVSLRLATATSFKGRQAGYLVADIDAQTLLQPILEPSDQAEGGLRFTTLRDHHGNVVAQSRAGAPPSLQVDAGPVIRQTIDRYGLALLTLPDRSVHQTPFTSPAFLGAMAFMALPLMLAVGSLWHSNNHQLILRTRLQATRQQRERLRLQNERLRNEIDRRVASEQELTHQANYDQLTGLPNRNLALDRLDQAIRWARREDSCVLALFVDLDRFKQVNDSLGHAAGDDLLREAAHRLQSRVRERDTVSRLGGDEFLVICTDVADGESREQIARLLLSTLSAPFYIGDHEFFVGGSIGMAAYPEGGDTPHKLLKNADIAMYAAKQNGRNGFALYDPTMDASALETVHLERNLRHALARDELYLVFQPIVDLASGRTMAFEALLRWHNAELGEVSPTRFIPVAEETGLIHEIGEWVMRQACLTLGALHADSTLRVAVNLSPKQFSHPSRLLDCVLDALRKSGLMPEQLEIEITESILIDDRPEIAGLINQLDRIGVRLSLDDFGTGYSALNYLQRFPFDVLKIDRSFTRQVPDSEANASLIRAIIAMAHALDLEVVAEGIETRQQAGFLLVYHCEFGQGFLYSRPLPRDRIRHHLDEGTALSA